MYFMNEKAPFTPNEVEAKNIELIHNLASADQIHQEELRYPTIEEEEGEYEGMTQSSTAEYTYKAVQEARQAVDAFYGENKDTLHEQALVEDSEK